MTNKHGDLPFLLQKIHCYEVLNLFWKLFENRPCSFRETEFQPLRCILPFQKADIQFLENYFSKQITFKKDSKVQNNVFSAKKKVGHRGYLSGKTALLADIYIYGPYRWWRHVVMVTWRVAFDG